MTTEKIKGLISFASNSPGVPTGYGQQAEHLVNNMVRAGLKVAAMSNYGHEGGIETLRLQAGKIPHYPRSFTGYSDDSLPLNHLHFKQNYPDLPDAIFTLYDSWVYQNPKLNEFKMLMWAPVDHLTLPPLVHAKLKQENVTAISMAPHGAQLMTDAGIENTYIPHAVDTKIYTPTETLRGIATREFLGLKDEFLVGMVAANKSNGVIHRKAFAENLLAFSMFLKESPSAVLYLHTEPTKLMQGFDLIKLLKSCGIPPENVIFPDPLDLRYGLKQNEMSALYSAMDVLLAPSYGEGFGVPTIEAQACGTDVIVSDWCASKDLVAESGWKVVGHPFWDEAQSSWYKIPDVGSILNALKSAEKNRQKISETALSFASAFAVEKIWREKWLPFLRDYFAK